MTSKTKWSGPHAVASRSVVLVVDDERSFRIAVERWLSRHHIRCVCAPSATLALQILSAWPVSVVVADQRMPDMDGLALLEQVGKQYPGVGRLLVTGDTAAVEDICRRLGITVIDKGDALSQSTLLEEIWFLTGERHGRQE
jgi:DNA-binding NtrC family response regulator